MYATFSGTWDEPITIAAGMEWPDKGTYTYEWQQPPLARIAAALGPYLAGLRSKGLHPYTLSDVTADLKEAIAEGNAILESHGNYQHNLILARLGNLPFLALACVVIFLWPRRWFSTARTDIWPC